MKRDNINRILKVAEGIGQMWDQFVFVGGSVAQLYLDNRGASDIRPTLDVDCII